MTRLLHLEWYKVRAYKPFWVILGLFTLCFFALGFFLKRFLDFFLSENLDEFPYFSDVGIPFFDFVDVWQNMGYVTGVFKWILAFIVIMAVTTEFGNKTVKQNVIDGLSKREFILSKMSLVAGLSLLAGILLFLLGLFLGLLYSPVKSPDFIFLNAEFVPAYMWQTFSFLCFAMMCAFLIRRTAVTIIIFLLYTSMIEPISTAIMYYEYDQATWYFPFKSIANMIRLPFGKYILREVQDFVAIKDLFVNIGWTGIFLGITYWVFQKRDV